MSIKELVVELLRQGHTVAKVADMVGCTVSAVYYHANSTNWTPCREPIPPFTKNQLRVLFDEKGKNITETAEILGVSRQTVAKYSRKWGIMSGRTYTIRFTQSQYESLCKVVGRTKDISLKNAVASAKSSCVGGLSK